MLSEAELQAILAKNPNIRVSVNGQPISAEHIGATKKPAKYRNKKVYVYADGWVSSGEKAAGHGKPAMVFDSVKEYSRWQMLRIMERGGKISGLERQVPFVIQEATVVNGKKLNSIVYVADFTYIENGKSCVEDVKPFDEKTHRYKVTKDFSLKWKLLQAKYLDRDFRLY